MMTMNQPRISEEKRETQRLPLAGVTVLLVEDEPDLCSLFQFILRDAGAEVVCILSASSTLEKIAQHQPQLLICDLRLPDVDGLNLIQAIRGQGISAQGLPAIAVSSYCREFYSSRVLQAGFQVFMPKPCDPDELIATAELLVKSIRG